jgi:ADP-ribose pyrophosphatase YjhB (NUDIX family)
VEQDLKRHSVSVAAAIVDSSNRALAVRRQDNGQWEPPGGVLELAETVTEGLVRELLEETGLVVEIERLTGVYKNMSLGIVALVFRCRAIGGDLVATSEVAEARWMTAEEIATFLDPAYAVRLLDALSDDPQVHVRSHDGVRLLTGP